MDILVISQLNSVVQSYIGKHIMIVVPSRCVKQGVDAGERANTVMCQDEECKSRL